MIQPKAEYIRKEKTKGIKKQMAECIDAAYQKGYEAGYQQHAKDFVADGEKAYQKGLEDAWNMLKYICLGGRERLLKVFGTISITKIITDYTAAEAKAKIDAWEQKEQQTDDLKVGDEVTDYRGYIFYVVDICDGDIRCWNKDGMSTLLVGGGLKKTGKHIDGIAEVLKQMQE